MASRLTAGVLSILTAALLTSCAPGSNKACVPNDQKACACVGGGTGAQVCDASGEAYGACQGCGGSSSGAQSSSSGGVSSGSGARSSSGGSSGALSGVTSSSSHAASSGSGSGSTGSSSGSTGHGVIESTASGGLWFDTATWVGGVVPAASDDVILHGEVQVNRAADLTDATCHNLNIAVEGVLRSAAYESRVIRIQGNLSNLGPVRNGPPYASYDNATLQVNLGGNFHQGAEYGPSATHFTGAADQSLSQAAGQTLGGDFTDDVGGSALVATSDLATRAITLTMNGATLNLGVFTLTLQEGDFHVMGGVVRATRIVGVAGATLSADHITAAAGAVTFEGDIRTAAATLEGNVVIAANAAFYNQANLEPAVTITGNLENNGVLRRGPGYAAYGEGNLTVNLAGNLTQNGQYTPTATNLTSSAEQTLTLVAPHTLSGLFTDTTPASALRAASDLVIDGAEFVLTPTGTLKMGTFKITHASGDLKIAAGTLEVDDITGGASDGFTTFSVAAIRPPSGTLTVHKDFRTSSVSITGNLVVASDAAVYNQYNVRADVTVSGSVTRTGIIRSGPGYASYDSGQLFLNGVLQ